MCNACGFLCCASDAFEGCGCEHCAVEACWPDEEFPEADDEGVEYWPPEPAPPPAACRVCGCTDARACPGGCSWVAADLCSACAGRAATP